MREVYSAARRSSESRESLQPRAACVRKQKRVEKPVGVEDANEGLRDVGGGDTQKGGNRKGVALRYFEEVEESSGP